MVRTALVVMPFLAGAAVVGLIVLIPLTWILRDAGPMYRAARRVLRMALWLAGVKVEALGPEPVSDGRACVYVANHASNVDPLVLLVCLPRVTILAKASVFRWPLLGRALRLAEFIPVERDRPASRREARRAAGERLKRGLSLLVFPEGTRSLDGSLLPFRPGPFAMALEAGAPIVPISLAGTREILGKGEVRIRPGTVRVTFHPPIPTAGLPPSERERLVQKARAAIDSALSPPARST